MHWFYDNISMEANREGSDARTKIDHITRKAWLHLNEKKLQKIIDRTTRDQSEVAAIKITGKTGWMTVDADDDLSKFEFHFLQLARHNIDQIVYAGFAPSDGSVEVNLASPPAWPARFAQQFCLDSNGDDMPFIDVRRPDESRTIGGPPLTTTVVQASFTVSMYDHPSLGIPLVVRNRKANADNYLLRVHRDLDFLTALVIRNKANAIKILAYLTWHSVWKFNYHWKDGDCLGGFYLTGNGLTADTAIKGPPTPGLADMITNPNTTLSETANALLGDALDSAFGDGTSGGGPGFVESTSWPPNVPSSFVTYS